MLKEKEEATAAATATAPRIAPCRRFVRRLLLLLGLGPWTWTCSSTTTHGGGFLHCPSPHRVSALRAQDRLTSLLPLLKSQRAVSPSLFLRIPSLLGGASSTSTTLRTTGPRARGASRCCRAMPDPESEAATPPAGIVDDGSPAPSTAPSPRPGPHAGPSSSDPSSTSPLRDGRPPPRGGGPPSRTASYYRRTRLMPVPDRGSEPTHAVFGTLLGTGAIASYRVYELSPVAGSDGGGVQGTTSTPLVEALVQLGTAIDGHPGVVHGGVLALLIDDVLGFAYAVVDSEIEVAYTANLNVNYRAPVPSGSCVSIRAFLVERTDRKLVFSCQVLPAAASVEEEGDVESTYGVDDPSSPAYCDATSVYVIPRGPSSSIAANRSVSNL